MANKTLKLGKKDYYDSEMIELGGEQFLTERERELGKNTQFNLLAACGFSVPQHGELSQLARIESKKAVGNALLSATEVVLETGKSHLPKLIIEDALKLGNAGSLFGWVYPGIQNELEFKRYIFIGNNVFEYSVFPDNSRHQLYWMNGRCSNEARLCTYGDVETTDDERFKIKQAMNLIGQFFPCFAIDVAIKNDLEIALGLSIGPVFEGTPIEKVGSAKDMAQVLLDMSCVTNGGVSL